MQVFSKKKKGLQNFFEIEIFAYQFKCKTWDKFKVFVLKVATLGLYLTLL